MNKFRFLYFTFIIAVFVSCQQKPAPGEISLRNYERCLVDKDTGYVSALLDDKFRLSVYQQPIAEGVVKSFIMGYNMPDSLVYGEVQEQAATTRIKVKYYYGGKSESSNITLSKNGQLLYSDLFDGIYGFKRFSQSKKTATLPFRYISGAIIIKARLNNTAKHLNMLFDTGADGMALRADLREETGVKITEKRNTSMPGGNMSINFSAGNDLCLDSLTIPGQNLVLFKQIPRNVDGIIGGSNFFRNYITEIDFDKHLIHLYSLGQFTAPPSYQVTDMGYEEGIPAVDLDIYAGDKAYQSRFIFDTGAGYDAIMFGAGFKHLNDESITKQLKNIYHTHNYSIGHKKDIIVGQTDSLCFGNMCFEQANLAIEAYDSKAHGGHTVNGSIGINLLRRFNWIVDLADYKIYMRPNTYSKLPLDFNLHGVRFGFIQDKRLFVKQNNVKTDDLNKNEFLPGDEVIGLGRFKPEDLSREIVEQLKQEQQLPVSIKRKGQAMSFLLNRQ